MCCCEPARASTNSGLALNVAKAASAASSRMKQAAALGKLRRSLVWRVVGLRREESQESSTNLFRLFDGKKT